MHTLTLAQELASAIEGTGTIAAWNAASLQRSFRLPASTLFQVENVAAKINHTIPSALALIVEAGLEAVSQHLDADKAGELRRISEAQMGRLVAAYPKVAGIFDLVQKNKENL
jgi:hypothetical protein